MRRFKFFAVVLALSCSRAFAQYPNQSHIIYESQPIQPVVTAITTRIGQHVYTTYSDGGMQVQTQIGSSVYSEYTPPVRRHIETPRVQYFYSPYIIAMPSSR